MAGPAFPLWTVMGFTHFWAPRDVCGIEKPALRPEHERKLARGLQALNHQMCSCHTDDLEKGAPGHTTRLPGLLHSRLGWRWYPQVAGF